MVESYTCLTKISIGLKVYGNGIVCSSVFTFMRQINNLWSDTTFLSVNTGGIQDRLNTQTGDNEHFLIYFLNITENE